MSVLFGGFILKIGRLFVFGKKKKGERIKASDSILDIRLYEFVV